jgi:hypothetical protein
MQGRHRLRETVRDVVHLLRQMTAGNWRQVRERALALLSAGSRKPGEHGTAPTASKDALEKAVEALRAGQVGA